MSFSRFVNFLRLTTNQHTRMKQNKNFKNKNQSKTMPFEGKINQLKREKLVLCSLVQFEGFKKALDNAHVEYDLGDFYNDGIIVIKK